MENIEIKYIFKIDVVSRGHIDTFWKYPEQIENFMNFIRNCKKDKRFSESYKNAYKVYVYCCKEEITYLNANMTSPTSTAKKCEKLIDEFKI